MLRPFGSKSTCDCAVADFILKSKLGVWQNTTLLEAYLLIMTSVNRNFEVAWPVSTRSAGAQDEIDPGLRKASAQADNRANQTAGS